MTGSRKIKPRDLGNFTRAKQAKIGLKDYLHPEATPIDSQSTTQKEAWDTISADLKHSADLWDILEVRTQDMDNPMQEMRQEIQRLKLILEENNF